MQYDLFPEQLRLDSVVLSERRLSAGYYSGSAAVNNRSSQKLTYYPSHKTRSTGLSSYSPAQNAVIERTISTSSHSVAQDVVLERSSGASSYPPALYALEHSTDASNYSPEQDAVLERSSASNSSMCYRSKRMISKLPSRLQVFPKSVIVQCFLTNFSLNN